MLPTHALLKQKHHITLSQLFGFCFLSLNDEMNSVVEFTENQENGWPGVK